MKQKYTYPENLLAVSDIQQASRTVISLCECVGGNIGLNNLSHPTEKKTTRTEEIGKRLGKRDIYAAIYV